MEANDVKDPIETSNLRESKPEFVQSLDRKLMTYLKDAGAVCRNQLGTRINRNKVLSYISFSTMNI